MGVVSVFDDPGFEVVVYCLRVSLVGRGDGDRGAAQDRREEARWTPGRQAASVGAGVAAKLEFA